MKNNNIERICQICRNKYYKFELNRFVFNNNNIYLDNNKRLSGKGCYVCKNKSCINSILTRKVFNRAFKTSINEENYAKLLKEINSCK